MVTPHNDPNDPLTIVTPPHPLTTLMTPSIIATPPLSRLFTLVR